jgi:protoheme IX farnesyltransferase
VRTTLAPGPWLRSTAAAALAATGAAVVSGAVGSGLTHRLLAALIAPPLAALVVAAAVSHRQLLTPAAAASAAVALAAAVPTRGFHVALAAAAFAAVSVLAARTLRGEHPARAAWRDYVTLTKPRIMTLLLLTGFCGLVAASHGVPGLRALAAMGGLALACGGASALNHVLDRDIGRLMGKRTNRRPVAAGRIPASRALEFGLALSAASFTLLAATVNVLTAVLALAGNLFYVVVYTRWLKRSTPQNIVIGGAAGAVPPLVGWAAAGHGLGLPALLLFAIVCCWTPPHFWALALLLKDEYARAEVPMLPVVRGVRETERQIVFYTVALTGVTLVPLALGSFGAVYGVAAGLLGVAFTVFALRLRRSGGRRDAALLFHYSLLYLALLFAAVAVDAVI